MPAIHLIAPALFQIQNIFALRRVQVSMRSPTSLRRVCASLAGFLIAAPFCAPLSAQQSVPRTSQQKAPSSAEPLALSLADAVNRAQERGDEMRIAEAQIDVSNAQVTIARSGALPQIRFNGSGTRALATARGSAVGAVFNQPYTYMANVNASQTLFQGGKLINGMRLAKATLASAGQSLEEQRAATNLIVQTAYLEALYAQRLVEIQQQAYDLAAARLTEAQQFLEAGRFSRYDVLTAKVAVANLEPLVIQARTNAEIALLEIRRLAKIPENQPIRLTTRIDSATITYVTSSLDTIASPAQRPALLAAEYAARASELNRAVARADLFPTVSFNYQFGYGAFPLRGQGFPTRGGRLEPIPCPPGTDPSEICTRQNGGWFGDRSMALTISWPLFDGLRIKGAISLANAQARIAEARLSATRDQVYNDFAKAKAGLVRAQALYDARRETVAEAREVYELAALRYTRGLATQLEVSDAQLALTTAETNTARAEYDVYLAAVTVAQTQGHPIPLPPAS